MSSMTRYLTSGPLRLDLKDERLFRDGEHVKLGGKPLLLLRALMERPQTLVTKEELIETVWDSRIVSDSVITTAVKELRIALGDDARSPDMIETAHGRGYRFMKEVASSSDESKPASHDSHPSRRRSAIRVSSPGWPMLTAGFALIVILTIALVAVEDLDPTSDDSRSTSTQADASESLGDTPQQPNDRPIQKSIAVLPFIDLSPDGDHGWFADGLSEELIHSLARTPDLRVASRSTSFQYKEDGVDLMEAAREMGVAHILEGSVRRSDDRVRVTAQLIRAEDGFHLWSQNYDSENVDVISIQEDIAFQIATALKTIMDPEKLRIMVEAGTRSIEAYEALLEGHFLSDDVFNPSGQGIRKSTFDKYEEARALDPNFAEAHWRAARAWEQRFSVFALPPEQTILTPEEIAQNFEDRVNAAIQTAPNPVRAKFYSATLSVYRQKYRDALIQMSDYVAEQPNDINMQIQRIKLATYVADYDTARQAAHALAATTDKNSPEFERTIPNLIWAKDFAAAREQGLLAVELAPFDSYIRYQAHRALVWAGDADGARQLIPEIEQSQLPNIIKVMTNLRQACAEGNTTRATALAGEARAQPNLSAGIRWIINMIVNDQEAAYSGIADLDQQDTLQQLAEFMLYPHFDSNRFPVLTAALKADFIERPAPTPLPFACS